MPDNVPVDKAALRAQFAARRANRTPEQIADARAAIRQAVTHAAAAARWQRVAAYVALRTEPGSPELLAALDATAQVLVPVLLPDRDLDWALWGGAGDTLGPDAIGTADAVLVPALAVARDGVRLGRGGGSYDRALARVDAATPVIALLYADELVDELPSDPWDRPVTAVVTPTGWRTLG